jgi:hypothetical protein
MIESTRRSSGLRNASADNAAVKGKQLKQALRPRRTTSVIGACVLLLACFMLFRQRKTVSVDISHFQATTSDASVEAPQLPLASSLTPPWSNLFSPLHPKQVQSCRAAINRLSASAPDSLTLILYHLGGVGPDDGTIKETHTNNVKIFTSALLPDTPAFVIFNVVEGVANPFYHLLPQHLAAHDRMCVIDWGASVIGDMTVGALTAVHLSDVLPKFDAMVYLNQGTRGPLMKRENSAWLSLLSSMLMPEKRIVFVGTQVNCMTLCRNTNYQPYAKQQPKVAERHLEEKHQADICRPLPHIQTHFYALSTSVVPLVAAYELAVSIREMQDRFAYVLHVEVGLSQFLWNAGYHLADFARVMNNPKLRGSPSHRWNGVCTRSPNDLFTVQDVRKTLFVKFGGHNLRVKDAPEQYVVTVTRATQAIVDEEQLVLPYWPEHSPYTEARAV